MNSSLFEKILDDQMSDEIKAIEVLNDFKKLILENNDMDLANYALVPIYSYLSNFLIRDKYLNFTLPAMQKLPTKTYLLSLKCYFELRLFKKSSFIVNGNISKTALKHATKSDSSIIPIFTRDIGPYNSAEVSYCMQIISSAFTLNEIQKKLIYRTLSAASKASRFYSKVFKENQISKIITGTGSKIDTRVASKIASDLNIEVLRYSHGGERGFFRDKLFLGTEFFHASTYMVHGSHEEKGLKEFSNTKIFGSEYHRFLFEKKLETTKSWSYEVVYALPSDVYPYYQYPEIKFEDKRQHVIQLEIIKYLKGLGYKVLLKAHPKSASAVCPKVKELSNGVVDLSMEDALDKFENWVFDYSGSAMIEALSAAKNILFFDLGLRKKSKLFKDLFNVIFVANELSLPSIKLLQTYFMTNSNLRHSFAKGFFE